MDEIETVANNDQRKLVGQFSFLEEILDFFGVVVVAFPANTFHLPNLASACSGLDVLEVDFRILADVHHRPEIVVEA